MSCGLRHASSFFVRRGLVSLRPMSFYQLSPTCACHEVDEYQPSAIGNQLRANNSLKKQNKCAKLYPQDSISKPAH